MLKTSRPILVSRQLDFIDIDGSLGEGGGQILRTAVSLSCVFNRPIKIANIRKNRSVPGLRPQHLQSVLASAKLCNAKVSGANVGSTKIEFIPGEVDGSYTGTIDCGTAGSISLIAQTIIPISIFRKINLHVTLHGGTEVPNSPTIDYIQSVVLPIYREMCHIDLKILRRGYYPRGGGIVELACSNQKVSQFSFPTASERPRSVSIMSVSRRLPDHVSVRQLESAKKALQKQGFEIGSAKTDHTGNSFSPGSSILIYLISDSSLIGSSSLGQRGLISELVGEEAAKNFVTEAANSPNVDSNLADMLLTLFCVGSYSFTTSSITNHFKTNAEIATKISGCVVEYHKFGSIWQVTVNGSSEKPNR